MVIEYLKRVAGLSVRSVEPPSAANGIFADEKSGTTVFTVVSGGKVRAFEIDGCGEGEYTTAALCRELASAYLVRQNSDEPLRAYLEGNGDVPHGVHIGKADYYCFAVYCEAGKSVREYLTTMASNSDIVADMTENVTAFCKKIDNDSDYQSAGEFAAVLRENISEEIKYPVKIGVGGVARGASELPQYYGFARSALSSGAEFDPEGDVYSYKEYAFIKTLAALTATEKENYLKTVLDRNYREVLTDAELRGAAEAFIKHSLNISEASRSLYVHRNTLIYRLDKLEKITGLNIRNFSDAMTFRVACIVYKLS